MTKARDEEAREEEMGMIQSHEPIHLPAHQLDQAIEVMARAFQNDPMLKYLVHDDARRARLLPSFFGTVVRYCLRYGEVYTTATLDGLACWLPPGNTTPTIGRMLRIGVHVSPLQFGWMGLRRYAALADYTYATHKRSAPGQHWYLWALGVDPPRQGQGIGGMLMQPVLAQADGAALPCYLETENERNVLFYQKYGFQVGSEGEVPKGGLHVWGMLRESR
jgi:ribosomal protein S18 acetylase RimI-like enzyme